MVMCSLRQSLNTFRWSLSLSINLSMVNSMTTFNWSHRGMDMLLSSEKSCLYMELCEYSGTSLNGKNVINIEATG